MSDRFQPPQWTTFPTSDDARQRSAVRDFSSTQFSPARNTGPRQLTPPNLPLLTSTAYPSVAPTLPAAPTAHLPAQHTSTVMPYVQQRSLPASLHTVNAEYLWAKPASQRSHEVAVTSLDESAVAPRDVTSPSDPWAITTDQKAYYLAHFLRLQSNLTGFLDGQMSKAFFELSTLSVNDLSRIWELSDVDCDGQLSLGEFSVAMHLTVLRRNGVNLPCRLPPSLLQAASSCALSTTTSSLPRSGLVGQQSATSSIRFDADRLENKTSDLATVDYTPVAVESQNLAVPTSSRPSSLVALDARDSYSLVSTPSVRHRRWSASSQSDVVSLAEGLATFDSRLVSDAQLRQPVPIRMRTLSMHEHEFPFDAHLAALPRSIAKPASAANDSSGARAVVPPQPPPRARVKCPEVGGLTSQVSSDSNHLLPKVTSSQPTQSLTASVKNEKTDNLSTLLTTLQTLQEECSSVKRSNQVMGCKLMQLQKRRISLEILLERLTPLEAL